MHRGPGGAGEMFQNAHSSSVARGAVFQRFNGPSQCFQLFHLMSAVVTGSAGGEAPGVFELTSETGGLARFPGG
jgi:hypothetical protein